MNKICRIGTIPYTRLTRISLHVKIEMPMLSNNILPDRPHTTYGYLRNDLSITGIEGAMHNGNCKGGCGQIDMHYAHRNLTHDDRRYSRHDLTHPHDICFAKGWNRELWWDLLEAWHLWHMKPLNQVPISVKLFLMHLPDADKLPAWI